MNVLKNWILGDNMRVVKINAIWCSGCLVMNKIWKNINKDNNIDTLDLDYDMDEE